jgi:hypothetical protein
MSLKYSHNKEFQFRYVQIAEKSLSSFTVFRDAPGIDSKKNLRYFREVHRITCVLPTCGLDGRSLINISLFSFISWSDVLNKYSVIE